MLEAAVFQGVCNSQMMELTARRSVYEGWSETQSRQAIRGLIDMRRDEIKKIGQMQAVEEMKAAAKPAEAKPPADAPNPVEEATPAEPPAEETEPPANVRDT